jgi:hypothetical protein
MSYLLLRTDYFIVTAMKKQNMQIITGIDHYTQQLYLPISNNTCLRL